MVVAKAYPSLRSSALTMSSPYKKKEPEAGGEAMLEEPVAEFSRTPALSEAPSGVWYTPAVGISFAISITILLIAFLV